jgi:hypothetical protein
MELYVGMDVSLKETSICVVDGNGRIVCEGAVISEPSAIAEFVKAKAVSALRIGLETGPTTTWLWHELRALGLPVICIDARHAKAALSLQINKSDRNDAVGLARIMQAGWYKEVQVKSLPCHEVRALLNSRALLVKIKRVFSIDPPAPSNAIMRKAKPPARREQWTRQAHHGGLDPNSRVREHPRLRSGCSTGHPNTAAFRR